jgi:hypothetical protein
MSGPATGGGGSGDPFGNIFGSRDDKIEQNIPGYTIVKLPGRIQMLPGPPTTAADGTVTPGVTPGAGGGYTTLAGKHRYAAQWDTPAGVQERLNRTNQAAAYKAQIVQNNMIAQGLLPANTPPIIAMPGAAGAAARPAAGAWPASTTGTTTYTPASTTTPAAAVAPAYVPSQGGQPLFDPATGRVMAKQPTTPAGVRALMLKWQTNNDQRALMQQPPLSFDEYQKYGAQGKTPMTNVITPQVNSQAIYNQQTPAAAAAPAAVTPSAPPTSYNQNPVTPVPTPSAPPATALPAPPAASGGTIGAVLDTLKNLWTGTRTPAFGGTEPGQATPSAPPVGPQSFNDPRGPQTGDMRYEPLPDDAEEETA